MWKYLTKDQQKEFILSLNLIDNYFSDAKKLNLLYAIANHPEKYYTKKYINKRNGTKRELLVPKPILKKIQKNILKNILYGLNISEYATGYRKGYSLKDNARKHINQKIILKLDMKDFFSNILFENLYHALPKEIFPPFMKVLIIKLCTYEDYLPQGAPTSPYLSNLVMKNFDNYIGKYCLKEQINYTRYCDDLTFSGDFNVTKLKNKVKAFVEELGFNLNEAKTKVLKKENRQIVTGVIVNEKMNTPKSYRKTIRQEMYYLKKYGLDSHLKRKQETKEKYLLNILGRIHYVLMLNPQDENFKEYRKTIESML